MKKLLTSIAILASLSGTAVADQVAWDASWGASEQGGVKVTNIEEMVFAYNSQSVVTDNGDGVISVGDTIHSYGGIGASGFNALASGLELLGLGGVDQNNVGSFSPNPFPTMDGYGTDYVFSFYFNDLMGVWDGSSFAYSSGTLHFGLESLDAVDTGLALGFHSLFDLDIASGGAENTGGQSKQVFDGTVSSFANGAGDDFSVTYNGTEQTLAEWATSGDVRFGSNQTVTAGFAGFPTGGAGVVFSAPGASAIVAANHTGRLSFSVPEPSSIAILGLGLLGFAGASRRKAK